MPDMLAGALAKQIRDKALAAREVAEYADLKEPGGLIDSMKERFTSLQIATKRARYLATNLSGFNATTKADVDKQDIDASAKEQVKTCSHCLQMQTTLMGIV